MIRLPKGIGHELVLVSDQDVWKRLSSGLSPLLSCQTRNLKSGESIDMDKTLLWEYTQVKDQIGPCHEEAPLV